MFNLLGLRQGTNCEGTSRRDFLKGSGAAAAG